MMSWYVVLERNRLNSCGMTLTMLLPICLWLLWLEGKSCACMVLKNGSPSLLEGIRFCKDFHLSEGGSFQNSIKNLKNKFFQKISGGISPHLKSLNDIRSMKRPIAMVISPGLVQDLLWADPNTEKPKPPNWEPNPYRNCSVMFGPEAVRQMCKTLGVHMIMRAHQVKN